MNNLSKLIMVIHMILFASCGNKNKNADTKSNNNIFCVKDSMMKFLTFDTVKSGNLENELFLGGKIQAIPSKYTKIFPLISGIIKNIFVELGDYVTEGQPLVEIISGDVAEFEKELSNAEADHLVAIKNLNVAKDMFESKLISEKEFMSAQKEVEKTEAELKRLKAIFKIYHINESGTYTLKSPISGYIVSKNITGGMQIRSDNNEEIMAIADIDKLWVIANVYESDMSKIRLGETASIETIAYPDTLISGKIDKIFEILDPNTRTMKIAIEINNKSHILKPEMYARVKIHIKNNIISKYINSKNIVFDNGKNYVLIWKGKCNIEPRKIEILNKSGDKVYIASGVNTGEILISKGNLLLYDAIVNNE
ncbi:MAG: efflux RND transporter periplasmic adaptor subunit [Bacteroidia bacterium]|nr:efflux RND transporter periplasmic adaptor subunit [Bacteroidia bacterium]